MLGLIVSNDSSVGFVCTLSTMQVVGDTFLPHEFYVLSHSTEQKKLKRSRVFLFHHALIFKHCLDFQI